ncbi:MAG: DUF2344 domain-containing protein [Clostridia bacterium]|nr:DUF2344 domain-containing protein [Clostridia bacterium]
MVQPIPVRAKFFKVGMLQYISHLDLVRTMTRNLVRAKIPAWYSQGFNPRLKLTFSLPLSIGTQSECEFFDIRLTEPMAFDEIKRRINETLTDEMQVVDVYTSEKKFSDIGWAEYELKLTSPNLPENAAESLANLYTNPLVLTKRSKTGDKDVDIAPFIDLRECVQTAEGVTIRALLSADSANYLNPEYLIKAADQKLGIRFDDPFSEYYTIMRREVYLSDRVTVFR